MKKTIGYCFILLVYLVSVSCSNSDEVKPRESRLLLLNEEGGISTYSYPSNTENNIFFDFDRSFSWDKWYSDVVIKDEYAFLVTRIGGDIIKLSLAGLNVQVSNKNAVEAFIISDKSMELFQDQLIVGYYGGDPNKGGASFVKFYDTKTLKETDSIFLSYNQQIYDMEVIGTRLFISIGHSTTNKLLKFDINKKKIENEVTLNAPCAQLMANPKGKLWCFCGSRKVEVDPVSCTIIGKEEIFGINVYRSSAPSYALDEKSNTLFYFVLAAQPAPAPFLLASYDLNTHKEKVIVTFDEALMGDALIVLDAQRKEIVVGSGNHIYFFDMEGNLLREVDLKYSIHKVMLY